MTMSQLLLLGKYTKERTVKESKVFASNIHLNHDHISLNSNPVSLQPNWSAHALNDTLNSATTITLFSIF